MRQKIFIYTIVAFLFSGVYSTVYAQIDDKYVESDVVPLAEKDGFSLQTKAGNFLFKPYVLVQTAANFNYYDDEGLNLAEQEEIFNSGFSIPNAIIGMSGKAFGKLTFNIALNASKTGSNLLQQAWFDINIKDEVRIRAGKFKTPFQQGYLVTLGQTMFPVLPASMTTGMNLNMSLNALNPVFATGFDIGVQLHGTFNHKYSYQIGIFNGSGSSVNTATKGFSHDLQIPSLLYSGRFAWTPKGEMPTHQGSPDDLHNNKILLAISGSYNVDAQDRSSNDTRAGIEFSWLINSFLLTAEGYLYHMDFTERMQQDKGFTSYGAYIQAGCFLTHKLQIAGRYDFFDRNGTSLSGLLNMPAGGINYFFSNYNLKIQAMYQYIGRWGHDTQLDRDNDDTGMAMHSAVLQVQYSF